MEDYQLRRIKCKQDSGTDFGTTSEKSSILIRPAWVSPIWMSKKTMGRVTPAGASMDMLERGDRESWLERKLKEIAVRGKDRLSFGSDGRSLRSKATTCEAT
jgi:hypothetical protein